MLKNLFVASLLGITSATFAQAQTNPPPPVTRTLNDTDNREGMRVAGELNRINEQQLKIMRDGERRPLRRKIKRPPPEKITEEEQLRLEPALDDKNQFEIFLKQPKTGLFRLFQSPPCELKKGRYVYDVTCENNGFLFTGGGSFYSFKDKNHLYNKGTDLQFRDGKFFVRSHSADNVENYQRFGVYSRGIVVDLGKVEIEDVTPESKAVKSLSSLAVVKTFKELEIVGKNLSNKIQIDEYTFADSAPLSVGNTYGLNTLIYHNKEMIISNAPRRESTIIIFKVLRQENDKSLTILWKELSRTKTAKIR